MRKLGAGSWQSVVRIADFMWVSCVELVGGLWGGLGQSRTLTHIQFAAQSFMRVKVMGFGQVVPFLYPAISHILQPTSTSVTSPLFPAIHTPYYNYYYINK
jgi:hypothetical protein